MTDFQSQNNLNDRNEMNISREQIMDLAFTFHSEGNIREAKNYYQLFIDHGFSDPVMFSNFGVLCKQEGDINKAIKLYEKSIEIFPDSPDSYVNLGNLFTGLNRLKEAEYFTRKAIEIQPNSQNSYNNLAIILKALGKHIEARNTIEYSIKLNPNSAVSYNILGSIMNEIDELNIAKKSIEKALLINPNLAEAHINMSLINQKELKLEEGCQSIIKAIKLNPNSSNAYLVLGELLKLQDRLKEAEQAIRKALQIDPNSPAAHSNLAIILLKKGEFVEGWKENEWRWKSKDKKFFLGNMLKTDKPEWSPEKRGRVLLWAEQGLGDEIMYASLIPDFIDYVDHLIIKIDPRLIPLLKRSLPKKIKYVSKKDNVNEDEYDYHISMVTLPKYLRNTLKSFEKARPLKLKVNQQQSESIRSKLINKRFDKIIGISWKSRKKSNINQCKSLTLENFILKIYSPSICFVSLQYGEVKEEITQLKEKHNIDIYDFEEIDKYKDIDGLASLINACDQVVSMRNSTVPLAGAVGIKSNILIPTNCFWWWGLNDTQSYWYPSLKLFRQQKAGEWDLPFRQIKEEIK